MVALRKTQAGSDSFGNVWPRDGSVIDVPPEQAVVLLRIRDGGITEVPALADVVKSASQPAAVPKPATRPPAKR